MSLALIVAALAVVAINAFFVAAEFAIVRVRATRIEELVADGVRRAAAAQHVLRRLDDSISACQLGITLASLALGWIGDAAFARPLETAFLWMGSVSTAAAHTVAIAVSFLIITFLHVVLGELVPKTLAIAHAERTALTVAWPLRIFHFFFYPLITFMNGSANLAVRAIGLRPPSEASLAHSEAELRMILAVSRRSGALTEAHGRLLSAALDFPDRAVRQLMVPRADILYLDLRWPYGENRRRALEYGHTRLPLCDGAVDQIVGIIHVKDLFMAAETARPPDLRTLARPTIYFPESASIQQVLARFQKQRVHLGIVVDEYGGTAGLVTMEDVIEELIGEIQDEFDQESPRVQALPDGRLLLDAAMTITEFETVAEIHEDFDEEVETLGGLVLARLGRLARVGDVIDFGGRRIEVARVRGRRILRVLFG